MIILGIDPGSRWAGHGLIEVCGNKFSYLDSGVMNYSSSRNFLNRLSAIYDSCEKLIAKAKPDEIAIEALIYVKNADSLAKLAQARGAMVASFMKTYQDRVFEYSPNIIKQAVSGFGHADKKSIQQALNLILGTSLQFPKNDESDALAIALCHGLNRRRSAK